MSQKQKYKAYATKMYRWIKSQDSLYGIVYHNLREISNVDGIGMCVPFLSAYSKTFNNKEAYQLALKQLNIYNEYGVDGDTGIPAQGYSITQPHIKLGSCNWGRGISWYLCGLSSVNIEDLSLNLDIFANMFPRLFIYYVFNRGFTNIKYVR